MFWRVLLIILKWLWAHPVPSWACRRLWLVVLPCHHRSVWHQPRRRHQYACACREILRFLLPGHHICELGQAKWFCLHPLATQGHLWSHLRHCRDSGPSPLTLPFVCRFDGHHRHADAHGPPGLRPERAGTRRATAPYQPQRGDWRRCRGCYSCCAMQDGTISGGSAPVPLMGLFWPFWSPERCSCWVFDRVCLAATSLCHRHPVLLHDPSTRLPWLARTTSQACVADGALRRSQVVQPQYGQDRAASGARRGHLLYRPWSSPDSPRIHAADGSRRNNGGG
mmetsp:Transcript_21299/g.58573  ORF Transcript_21299/g.58573 Transcript_21299/m.58573 type:complete len:281 (-) Transcript_21299:1444-2286(-)